MKFLTHLLLAVFIGIAPSALFDYSHDTKEWWIFVCVIWALIGFRDLFRGSKTW